MGFEQLKNIIEENRKQAEIDREDAMNPTECPDCVWNLSENSKGELSCPICGRVWK